MSSYRFSTGKLFKWNDNLFRVKRTLQNNQLVVEEIASAETRLLYRDELVKALFRNELFFVDADNYQEIKPTYLIELSDYSPYQIEVANHRLKIIQPLLELSSDERTALHVKKYIADLNLTRESSKRLKQALSTASVYRWMKSYTDSGNDLRSLIPNTHERGGKNRSRLPENTDAIVKQVIEANFPKRESITLDELVWEIVREIKEQNNQLPTSKAIRLPSRGTVARRLKSLDDYDVMVAKKGKRAAERKFAQYSQTEQPRVPLERVEIDHTRLDLIVVDENDNLALGRPTLTYCIDCATRCILGYCITFEPPSYSSVMQCLYHAIQPKQDLKVIYGTKNDWPAYGIPYALITDNGKEFVGKDLADACSSLGITLQHMPPQMPHFKAIVERHLGTLNTMFIHGIPGTTFSNPNSKGDYNSVEQACISLNDLKMAFCIFVVDLYSQRPHKGIGTTPSNKWAELTQNGFAPRLPASADDLLILLGRVETRVIQHYGIEFEGLRFNAPDLASIRHRQEREKVKFKYDPQDISRIHVFDPFEQRYIEIPALAREYTQGLSLWKHRVVRSLAREAFKKVDMAALAEARRRIQTIVEDGRKRVKLRTRTRIARWENAGKGEMLPREARVTTSEANATDLNPEQASLLWSPQDDSDDWSVDFSLPRSRGDFNSTGDKNDD